MSFSSDVKNEIIKNKLTKKCCINSTAYAIVCFSKYYDDKGLVLNTEQDFIAEFVENIFLKLGISGTIITKGTSNNPLYEFNIKQVEGIKKLQAMFKCSDKIDENVLKCDFCIQSFISTAFLCIGTVTNPQNEYNLEFVFNKKDLLLSYNDFLVKHNLNFKYIKRKNSHVLYIKNSADLEDILTIMGADSFSFELMNLKIYKEYRNMANRVANCETSNISKTINANQNTIKAIQYLQSKNALSALSEELQELAYIRLENPESTLLDLSKMLKNPMSKSGLSHRLKKIERIANDFKIKNEG